MPIPVIDHIKLSKEEEKTKKTPSLEECITCKTKCCRYVTVEFDVPEDLKDFQEIRWMIAHENVSIHVDEGDWGVEFKTPCAKLGDDGKCTIYETRPDTCREYGADMLEEGLCEGFQNVYKTYDHYFETMEELEAFIPGYLKKVDAEDKEARRLINRIKSPFIDVWNWISEKFSKED